MIRRRPFFPAAESIRILTIKAFIIIECERKAAFESRSPTGNRGARNISIEKYFSNALNLLTLDRDRYFLVDSQSAGKINRPTSTKRINHFFRKLVSFWKLFSTSFRSETAMAIGAPGKMLCRYFPFEASVSLVPNKIIHFTMKSKII